MSSIRELLERHAESGQKLSLETFIPDRRDTPDEELVEDVYTLIKGSPQSLRFLGELLIKIADSEDYDDFDMHPQGAGGAHFSPGTKLGIYFLKESAGEGPVHKSSQPTIKGPADSDAKSHDNTHQAAT